MAESDYTEVYLDDAGSYRWRRRAGNHQIIASSGEAFASKFNAERAAERAFPEDKLPRHPTLAWAALVIFAFLLGLWIGWLLPSGDDKDAEPVKPTTTTTSTALVNDYDGDGLPDSPEFDILAYCSRFPEKC